jgi:hypothetical protein
MGAHGTMRDGWVVARLSLLRRVTSTLSTPRQFQFGLKFNF